MSNIDQLRKDLENSTNQRISAQNELLAIKKNVTKFKNELNEEKEYSKSLEMKLNQQQNSIEEVVETLSELVY
jgi:predicted  nucleic acid-binding Zn-ribbon protein